MWFEQNEVIYHKPDKTMALLQEMYTISVFVSLAFSYKFGSEKESSIETLIISMSLIASITIRIAIKHNNA